MKYQFLTNRLFLSVSPLVLFAFVGCTWVKPIENASEVALVKPIHVALCESMGTTNVSVKDGLGPLKRNAEKVESELATLAKNSAVSMGGDTVVAISNVDEGGQEFDVYKCN